MDGTGRDGKKADERSGIARILEERAKLDQLIQSEFTKRLTVMFTDIKGSTAFYDSRGDIDGRVMVHRHNEIVLPAIAVANGTLIKTIGDATLSVYQAPADGVKAAIAIQRSLREYNAGRTGQEQIHVRIGLNHGLGIQEESDVFGDVVNVAARVESLADGDQIFITDDLYREVRSTDEFIFRLVKTVELKGKRDPLRLYRVLWHEEEISLGKTRKMEGAAAGSDGMFVIEASVTGGKLKVSGFERAGGRETAVKEYEEIAYDAEEVKAATEGIVDLLNRANRRGRVGTELLVGMKEHGRRLFGGLLPRQLRERLEKTDCRNLMVSIDDNLVHIPWELLHDGRSFFCQRFSMGRTVSTRQRVSARARAIGTPLKVQILADPCGDLKAAQSEGLRIRDEIAPLDDLLDVSLKTAEIDGCYVRAKLKNFDVVHYAGHAEHDALRPEESGWLLKDGKFSAAQVVAMAGVMPMPALIFSNACRSGQTDQWRLDEHYERKIFGLANAFLLAGVQHYIGTFWEIPDEAGQHFAVAFYRSLAAGVPIGEAMRRARQSLVDAYGEDRMLWASYMLYGDPGTRYVSSGTEALRDPEEVAGTRGEPLGADTGSVTGREDVRLGRKSRNTLVAAAALLALTAAVAGFLLKGGGEKEAVTTVVHQPTPSPQAAGSEERSRRIDTLIAGLAKDFREGRTGGAATNRDDWTTKPLTIVFMDIRPGGPDVDRMTALLSQKIQDGGRASVVERELLAKLLEELQLSGSALADPATALKIGRVLSARLIVAGSVLADKKSQTVLLRFVDTETTAVLKVIAAESGGSGMSGEVIDTLSARITDFMKTGLPARGRVVAVDGDACQVNLGRAHGLKEGDRLEVVSERRRGSGLYQVVGEILITELGPDESTCRITGGKPAVTAGAKVREKPVG